MKKIMQKISLKQTRLFALIALLSGFVAAVPAYGNEGAKACKAALSKLSLVVYNKALESLCVTTKQGHASAQYRLSAMYKFGTGVRQDYTQAHMWFNIASANGSKVASKNRDEVVGELSRAQIARAQKMARQWMQKHPKK